MTLPAIAKRWNEVRSLGQGGQGSVELVTDATGQFNGHFARKRLRKNPPAKVVERFKKEIEVIQRLDHPNIIKIVDCDIEDDRRYYVMEYFEGAQPLTSLMRQDKNTFFRNALIAMTMYRQLLSAIVAWTERGILHRDLSPGNILILPDQNIRVIDFGICQISGNDRLTLADEGVGTKDYMAPECEPGSQETLQLHADVYSSGKILWSAITNKFVFARESPVFKTHSMACEFPKAPWIWHLQRIFEWTIRHKYENRQSAASLLNALWLIEHKVRTQLVPEELAGQACPLCFGNLQDVDYIKLEADEKIVKSRCSKCFAFFEYDRGALIAIAKERSNYD